MLGSLTSRPALLAVAMFAGLGVVGCSSTSDRMRNALGAITPYKVEVVQGNVVTKEQADQLQPGMTRQQVREILGTPLLTDIFHSNRWDYVFTLKRQGVDAQQRRLTVFFNGDTMERFEGDTMPAEEEFVATIDNRKKSSKVPTLEASEDQLKKYDAPAAAKSSATQTTALRRNQPATRRSKAPAERLAPLNQAPPFSLTAAPSPR